MYDLIECVLQFKRHFRAIDSCHFKTIQVDDFLHKFLLVRADTGIIEK